MSKLGDARREHTVRVAKLIFYAQERGWELAGKDWHRASTCGYGHTNSLHRLSLATDFDLYIDGEYIKTNVGHLQLHKYWEEELGGAKMIVGDSNHYATAYDSMR